MQNLVIVAVSLTCTVCAAAGATGKKFLNPQRNAILWYAWWPVFDITFESIMGSLSGSFWGSFLGSLWNQSRLWESIDGSCGMAQKCPQNGVWKLSVNESKMISYEPYHNFLDSKISCQMLREETQVTTCVSGDALVFIRRMLIRMTTPVMRAP